MDLAQELADRIGLVDVFVLRRVSEDQLVNLAGSGRGRGWAGNISIEPEREPLVARALASPELVRHAGESVRIFGPYWSDAAALVSVGDYVVIMGGAGTTTTSDEALVEAAGDFAWAVGDVSAEKRLADELELTQAALAVASLPARTIDEFFLSLADAAAEALSCEFGAVVVRQPERRLVLAPSGWQPSSPPDLVLGALLQLLAMLEPEGPVVAQDLRDDPFADSPLGFREGLVSRCVIPLEVGSYSAAIVVAHMVESPRGFTSLCQQVATSIGEQAEQVLTRSFGEEANVAPTTA